MDNFEDLYNKVFVYIANNYELEKYITDLKKFKIYTCLMGINYIRANYKDLELYDYSFIDNPENLKSKHVLIVLHVKPQINHPYIIYGNYDTRELKIVNPFGKYSEYGQIDLKTYQKLMNYNYLSKMTKADYYGIYCVIYESMLKRKDEIYNIRRKNSLLNCAKITQCVKKIKDLEKEKNKMGQLTFNYERNKIEQIYAIKAEKLLDKYFYLLDHGNYEEARKFLNVKDSTYFGKVRLDTFFTSSQKDIIIKHLYFFIDLYMFFVQAIKLYNDK